jgi:predicted AlkP superfamily phosphohydrolase/phosphomutase
MRISAAALLLVCIAAGPASARVVIVGVDGASWNLIDPLAERGELPNLSALRARGVEADFAVVEPVSSPAVWTSLATGRDPDAHGVTHFYVTRRDVRVPAMWDRLAAAELRVGLYDWLVSWPPREFPGGFAIPGWLRRDDRVAPADLFARAGVAPYAYSVDDVRTPEEFVANCREELREKPGRFVKLLEAFDADVAGVTFYSVDASSHRFWEDAFPGDFDPGEASPDARYAGAIGEMLRGVDAAIGEIAAALGPEDTLVVASDHGFEASGEVRRVWQTEVEDWVAREGLDPERDGFEVASGFAFVILRVRPGPFAEREATLARLTDMLSSARTPEGDPLFGVEVLDSIERPPGAERPWSVWLRQLGLRLYLWWLDVEFDEPAHAWVFGLHRDEALEPLWPDGEVQLGERALPIRDFTYPHEFSGAHNPTGVFVAAGRGIRTLEGRVSLSVLDVAPLVFWLAGQPIPDDLEGRLPEEILDPALLAASPPRVVPAASVPVLADEAPAPAGEAGDEEILERLRSLGYAE